MGTLEWHEEILEEILEKMSEERQGSARACRND